MNTLKTRTKINAGASIYDLELRVVYYARVSTDKDAQLNSLGNQIFYFDDLIKKQKNWTLVDGYIDEGLSGKSAENRQSFMRMIRDASMDKFDLIITKEISRFSRNTLDSIMYTRQLLDCGVGVYFQADNINTLMPDSELRLTIMASIAQEEVRKLSERLRFGYKRSIEKGRILGQDNMLGYHKKDGKLTVNEEEAAMIRRLFEVYGEGKIGLRGIARQLEKEGFVSPNTGKMYGYSTLQNIIRNPKCKGYYCSRKTVSVDYRDNRQRPVPEDEWVVHKDENIPAIVSEEVWEKANTLYKQRSTKMKEKGGSFSARYPLSGKLICAEHGESYHRHVYKSKKRGEQEVWNCKLYRLKGKVEGCDSPTIYTSEIAKILGEIYRDICKNRENVIQQLMEAYSQAGSSGDFAKEIAAAEKEIADTHAKKDKLLELMMEGLVSKEEFKKRNDRMNADIESQAAVISSTKNARELATYLKQEVGALRETIGAAYDDLDNLVEGLTPAFLDKIIIHKVGGDKRHLRLEISLNIGKTYEAELKDKSFTLNHEIGISQAQVSRLEKSALTRIKKQL
ncbi:MAG: recombinase family protein [Oscillospiraceae bacterium]|nr:recombinase family protein [Oscillospiraceae bacterium]